ncbi:pyruvate dehydrogenase kinase [Klebsormidium nitens]|uniref:Protein-serine/threonine kinase n=1 Tax=Klebsormidium nitens TaxID=105231 RepID=A0A1Y1IGQ1_KLENI|nr:pyruvate dehydrogenase kinase [Klebsormidium nitens]|eukprot:GAQ87906.1 pyruvate dehydrogenase kinase [Klebsormidium nitens]
MLAAQTAVRRLADSLPRSLVEDVFKCSFKKQTGVSLKYMMDFGAYPTERNLLMSAQFLHKELPVRLAHRVTELEQLPYGLSAKAPVLKVRDWYLDSFQDLRSFREIATPSDEMAFTKLLAAIKERHNHVVPTMAMGIQELKHDLGRRTGSMHDLPDIHQFLDRFFMSRIGIRMLIGQHIELHKKTLPDGYIGLIHTRCSPVEVAEMAIEDARATCMRTYGGAPDVKVYGDRNFTFAYVPSHLHHMLFELVKNSLRAVQERFDDADVEPPPIRVVVADGLEDVTIKISDEGGGIPRSGMPKIWTYMYTTAQSVAAPDNMPAVLAGYGYGLPVSRLYAKYFGGDLQIISMEGYGTDAYLHLNRLGNVQEPLP